jgi:hypothetical protein
MAHNPSCQVRSGSADWSRPKLPRCSSVDREPIHGWAARRRIEEVRGAAQLSMGGQSRCPATARRRWRCWRSRGLLSADRDVPICAPASRVHTDRGGDKMAISVIALPGAVMPAAMRYAPLASALVFLRHFTA